MKSEANDTDVEHFIGNVLGTYGVTDFQVNEKNVLLARLAINQFFADDNGYTDEINSFNKKETVASIRTFLKKSMKDYEPGGKYENPKALAKLQIFLAALTGEGLGGPSSGQAPKTAAPLNPIGEKILIKEEEPEIKTVSMKEQEPEIIVQNPKTAAPLNPIDEKNLIKEEEPEIKNVSMQQQGPDISKILPKNISFDKGQDEVIRDAINTIDQKFKFNAYDGGGVKELSQMMMYSDFTDDKVELFETTPRDFVEAVLKGNNINTFELTPKNVLIVIYAIADFFGKNAEGSAYGWAASYGDVMKIFSSPDGQKKISDDITKKMEECKPDAQNTNANDYQLLAIFRAAVSETNLANLSQGPVQPQLNMDLKA